MASNSKTTASNGSLLAGLLAPLRLPERAMEALDSVAGAGDHLAAIRGEIVTVRERIESVGGMIEQSVKQTQQVPQMLSLVRRISKQAEPLDEMLPALERLETSMTERLDGVRDLIAQLESDESHLNQTVERLDGRMAEVLDTLVGLKADVGRVTDRMPDPNERGPLEKVKDVAKEALSGSGAQTAT